MKKFRAFLAGALFLTSSLAHAQTVVNPGGGGGSGGTVTQGPAGSASWLMSVRDWAGTTLGAPSAYGTSPGAVQVPGVNAFITNTPAVTQSGGPWTINQTQLNSVALGSPSAYGTSPGAVQVQGVNAFITNTPAVTQSGSPWGFNEAQLNSVALGSPSAYGTSPGAVNVQGVNAFITNTPAVTQSGGPWTINQTQKGGTAIAADPCETAIATQVNVNLSASGASQIIAASSGKKLYICSGLLLAAAADNVAVVEGTGSNCATGQTAVFGGTTTAAGLNLAANQGAVWNGSYHHHFHTNTASDAFCLNPSAAVQLTGYFTYVAQ